jgi:replicative DNA helicase
MPILNDFKSFQLQHDELAERTILGYLLIDNEQCDYIFSLLENEDFYKNKHKILYECFQYLWNEKSGFDVNLVISHLEETNNIKFVGNVSSIIDCLDGVPNIVDINFYVDRLKEKRKIRELFISAFELMNESSQPLCDIESVIQNHYEKVLKLNDSGKQKLKHFSEISKDSVEVIKKIQNGEMPTGIKTGYTMFDDLTGGFQDGNFIVIAARPSMGKTALALNMASNIATKYGKTVGFFSIEMTMHEIWVRLISAESEVKSEILRLNKPPIGKTEHGNYVRAIQKLNDSKILINDSHQITLLEIKSIVKSMINEKKLDIVFVDYLQLVKIPDSMLRRNDSRVQEVSMISAGLKALAKEQNIPVVAMAQLNRMPEKRSADSIKYQLSDLKESGAIEQDADIVMFLHREEQINRDTERKGEADLIIAKQRNGPTGVVELSFRSQIGKFINYQYGSYGEYENEQLF